MATKLGTQRRDGITAAEWRLRLDLAACYRIFDHLGWAEMIFNHITVRVPGPERHFLINPFGLTYREVTASNLVKIDRQGRPVGPAHHPVNPAGFIIHAAIHGAREDAHCVMHTHTTAGMAVACKERGLSHDNFYGAQLWGRVAYHDFEGITVHADEQPRLLAAIGAKDVVILRHHGLLVLGPSIERAFIDLWTLQRACDVQCGADALAGATAPLPQAVIEKTARDCAVFDSVGNTARLVFDAMVRRVAAIDASFRD
ncbi:MAG: class II aldolase/adducin family protein [Alphaproteobacteria bacterium]|nr:class II aldolase/adducin family protein [Alphaproteobacteria bacterium]